MNAPIYNTARSFDYPKLCVIKSRGFCGWREIATHEFIWNFKENIYVSVRRKKNFVIYRKKKQIEIYYMYLWRRIFPSALMPAPSLSAFYTLHLCARHDGCDWKERWAATVARIIPLWLPIVRGMSFGRGSERNVHPGIVIGIAIDFLAPTLMQALYILEQNNIYIFIHYCGSYKTVSLSLYIHI